MQIIKNNYRFFLIATILSTFLVGQHIPTSERGDPNYRRQTDIDGNKVRTSIFNFGLTGRTGANPGEIPYEWPINTEQYYVALTGLFVGAEVQTESGEPYEDLNGNDLYDLGEPFDDLNANEVWDGYKPFVTVPLGRNDDDGNSMMFEPVPEYLNPNSDRIAKSDELDSWPEYWPDKQEDASDPGWPDAWNGYFGKNQFNADQEIYFKISDDNNFLRGATYIPDSTDITRRGMGILAGVRVMEWAQVLVEDVVFVLNEIKNDGTKDLNKVAFSLWLADLVGGDGDNSDDIIDFDLIYDIAWSMDADGIGNTAFGSDRVGVAATAYLETPGNNIDRIDNDGDGEIGGPKINEDFLIGEDESNAIDDNHNGLIDENQGHIPFNGQEGVTYANGIDDGGFGTFAAESGSPVITAEMIANVAGDSYQGLPWKRWPPNPESDPFQNGQIHLIMVEDADLGKAFADNIDNNDSEEYPVGLGADTSGPRITREIINTAASDPYQRYRVPGTDIILYAVDSTDFDKTYADGIDNDGDGAIDEGIDEGIDEMIDESRDDHIDNDFDWNPFSDDNGLDGDIGTLDTGQGNSRPSSGGGTNLPGEPNIDKTDVSESDQMGLTAVAYDPAGSIPTGQDVNLWVFYMTPGEFWQPPPGGQLPGDNDLFVTSGYFPIPAGETQRIAMAVCLGADTLDARRNKDVAQKTYDEDYQFAKAPLPPNVKAIPGDNKVTLRWDDVSERSFDTYMHGLGSEGYDFEGYKIYKSTDAAFQDYYSITDAQGNLTFIKPIAQYDLLDGKTGWHDIAINGTHYYLGDDTGLRHDFIDYDVINGQTYYYAVVAYDYGGDITNEIPPTESTKRITISSLTGEVRKGSNVVIVTPNPPAAGYVDADVDTIQLVQGTTSSYITSRIVEPLAVLDGHNYRLTFEDTLKALVGPIGQDTITTKNYTLADITDLQNIDTLILQSKAVTSEDEQPLIDGFQLTFHNEDFVYLDLSSSSWSRDSLWYFTLDVYKAYTTVGKRVPADYRIEISQADYDSSTYFVQSYGVFNRTYPAVPTNFKVKKKIRVTGDDSLDWLEIPYAFGDFSPSPVGSNNLLDADSVETDVVIFLDDTTSAGDLAPTWQFKMSYPRPFELEKIYGPEAGDMVYLKIRKPFLATDIFEFTTETAKIDQQLAKQSLDNIMVVPNPYIASVIWEPRNRFSTGRGPRSIHFNNLPTECTIRIFSVSGELVKQINHQSSIDNGTAEWDLLTKENLSVSYGVYVYHVEAPRLGEHVGKFAVIK